MGPRGNERMSRPQQQPAPDAASRLLAIAQVLAVAEPELARAASERVMRCAGRGRAACAAPAAAPAAAEEPHQKHQLLEQQRNAIVGAASAQPPGAQCLVGVVCRVCASVLVPGQSCAMRMVPLKRLGRKAAARLQSDWASQTVATAAHKTQAPPEAHQEADAALADWLGGALDKSAVTKGVPAFLARARAARKGARRPRSCLVLLCHRCGHKSVVALGSKSKVSVPHRRAQRPPRKVGRAPAPAPAAKATVARRGRGAAFLEVPNQPPLHGKKAPPAKTKQGTELFSFLSEITNKRL